MSFELSRLYDGILPLKAAVCERNRCVESEEQECVGPYFEVVRFVEPVLKEECLEYDEG